MFIFQKAIDRSSLRQGFQIPVEYHHLLKAIPGGCPIHGETRNITIIIDGQSFNAQLKNQGFDQEKYEGHADVIQIRYGESSPLARHLRMVFNSSWDYYEMIKALPENINRKVTVRIPNEQQEYIALVATKTQNVFIAECITCQQRALIRDDIKVMDELDFETFMPKQDSTATIKELSRIQRVRYLDRSIGDSLKQIYDYRCQMTGERIGDYYGALVVEAHHIIPFTQSMNNDSSNIIIVSPSYHRIIHSAKPEWLPDSLSFKFPNGVIDKVRINKHLGAVTSNDY